MKFIKVVKATDGWDENNPTIQKIKEKLAEFDKINYEINSQVKGAYTNARTYKELMHAIKVKCNELSEIASELQFEDDI